MLSNYYTLAAVAWDLDARLREKTLLEAYSQDKNELVFSFGELQGGIVVSCTPEVNSLYWHPSFSRARTNSADVLQSVVGKSVRSVSIQTSDRVISFTLADDTSIHAQFFGSKANVLVTDSEQRIVEAFKDAKMLVGTMYAPRHGELLHDVTTLRSLITSQPESTLLNVLKRGFPVLGTTLVTEILVRGGFALSRTCKDTERDQIVLLEESFKQVLLELSHPASRVYIEKNPPHTPYRFAIIRLEQCGEFDEKSFDDIHEGIRYFVSRMRSSRALFADAERVRTTLLRYNTKVERAMTAIEEDLRKTSRAGEYEKYATLIMSNLDKIQKGMKSIELPGGGVSIPLEPKLSPVQNAQRYYEKAKGSKTAYEQSRERLHELGESHNLAGRLVAKVESICSNEELKQFMKDHEMDLEQFGIGRKAEERQQLPFRTFVVDGGFEVWAGKSSRNNDELTMNYAKPADLWFHARGGSGSHVILRHNKGKGEPGKKAKEQAAGIAAYYSKMKNAKMVPVAMTERKYVRKPKGAPPGTVTLEREKVIFAEPALPKN